MQMSTNVIPNLQREDHSLGNLEELVSHLRQKRERLCELWVRRISDSHLLHDLTRDEIAIETGIVYDGYLDALRAVDDDSLPAKVRKLSERIISKRTEAYQVVGMLLLLRDVVARSLFEKYHSNFVQFKYVLDEYEPAANQIANLVAVGFVRERDQTIRQQQEAIRNLSAQFYRLVNGH